MKIYRMADFLFKGKWCKISTMEMLGKKKNAFKEYSRFEGRIGESDFVIHEPETRKGIGRRFLVIIILYTLKLEWGKAGF